jgi:hypothetical protein
MGSDNRLYFSGNREEIHFFMNIAVIRVKRLNGDLPVGGNMVMAVRF